MAESNLDLMRRAFAAFEAGDVEKYLHCMDPDVVFEPRLAMVEGGYRGHEGVRQFMADAVDVMEVRSTDIDEIRDLDDRVLALGVFHVRGRESGAEDATPFAILATVEGGRISHLKDYGHRADALEAAGLAQ